MYSDRGEKRAQGLHVLPEIHPSQRASGWDLSRALVAQHQHQAALLSLIGRGREALSDVTVGWWAVSRGRLER